MSTASRVDGGPASAGPHQPNHPGWLVVDPAGRPYAWYSVALAQDASAATTRLEADCALRQQLLDAGWSVRAGSGLELVARSGALAKVSA